MKRSVYQGDPLSPLIFILCFNPLTDFLKTESRHGYPLNPLSLLFLTLMTLTSLLLTNVHTDDLLKSSPTFPRLCFWNSSLLNAALSPLSPALQNLFPSLSTTTLFQPSLTSPISTLDLWLALFCFFLCWLFFSKRKTLHPYPPLTPPSFAPSTLLFCQASLLMEHFQYPDVRL